jgi:hypothetical protein
MAVSCILTRMVKIADWQIADYPGKKDHYRKCLSIIAAAPGEERPGIQTFLDTGAMGLSTCFQTTLGDS